jgi:hypothetical protein
MESVLYDAPGQRRSPATMPGFHQGRSPRNKGLRYPADPPTIEEIIAVMRAAGQALTVRVYERSSSSCGEPVCGSVRHSTSPRLTWIRRAALSSFAKARAAVAEKSAWIAGPGLS